MALWASLVHKITIRVKMTDRLSYENGTISGIRPLQVIPLVSGHPPACKIYYLWGLLFRIVRGAYYSLLYKC